MKGLARFACALAIGLGAGRAAEADGLSDDLIVELRKLPHYLPAERQSGAIRAVGSSTVSSILSRWETGFQAYHPEASITIRAGGSGTAPPALTEGSADLAPMSRPMSQEEKDAFAARFGYPPTELTIALDALAVFVNVRNPVEQLTLQQVDTVFSLTRTRCGDPIGFWGDVGVKGDLEHQPLRRYGVSEVHGTHSLFKDLVLDGGVFRGDVRLEPGLSSVVNAVGAYPEAIGYAGQTFATKRTKAVALAVEAGGPYVPLTYRTCIDGEYPLVRKLFLYVNRKPAESLPPLVREFLLFTQCRAGQLVVAESGSFPIDATIAEQQREGIAAAGSGAAPAPPARDR